MKTHHPCKRCGKVFATNGALSQHSRDRHHNRQPRQIPANFAIEMADAMDLPDGAYFAMIGDLMGGDYMDGVEAVLAEGDWE